MAAFEVQIPADQATVRAAAEWVRADLLNRGAVAPAWDEDISYLLPEVMGEQQTHGAHIYVSGFFNRVTPKQLAITAIGSDVGLNLSKMHLAEADGKGTAKIREAIVSVHQNKLQEATGERRDE